MSSAAVVILAAGAGRRLGSVCKALLECADGTSFLERAAGTARAAGISQCVVVVGEPHRQQTEAEAMRLGLPCTVNPDPARGMASSIEVGFAYVNEHFADTCAALLWPVDHAGVQLATVQALLKRTDAATIAVPVFADRGGHPTLFGRQVWSQLQHCAENVDGARTVLRENQSRIERFAVADAGVVNDVDVPSDRGSC